MQWRVTMKSHRLQTCSGAFIQDQKLGNKGEFLAELRYYFTAKSHFCQCSFVLFLLPIDAIWLENVRNLLNCGEICYFRSTKD